MYNRRMYIMNKNIRWGIIGTITTLLVFGGIIVLSEDELDHAYYCDTNQRVGIFEYLSSTAKTGYWFEDGTRKQSTCTGSTWIPLRDYCESQGIRDCKRVELKVAVADIWTGRYLCRETCEKVY
jgi:hypothetical protein